MGTYQRIIQWLHGRKPVSTDAKDCGPTIEHITNYKNGQTHHTRVIGWTVYGKGHSPKDGYKPITIIDQP